MRPTFDWRLRSRSLVLGPRTLIMGVLNVTPDSFSDGGQFLSVESAVNHGLQMLAEGADIIDVGGESTRPGVRTGTGNNLPAGTVSAAEESRRVLPVIEGLRRAAPETVISVDTYKSEVAQAALAAGAEIVNDVSALRWDPAMASLVGGTGCGVVLMHSRGRPDEWNALPGLGEATIACVGRELGEWAAAAERQGVSRNRVVLDPGFGFGKGFEENYRLLARFDEFARLKYPLLAGTSRKSFIGRALSRTGEPVPPAQRLHGTLACVAACILKGAHIVRVHDVAPARETAAVCDRILEAK
jgi:dihydropteroate synthase